MLRLRIHERRWPTARAGAHGSALVVIRGSDQERVLEQDERRAFARGTVPLDRRGRSDRDAGASSAAVSMTTARTEVGARSRVAGRATSAVGRSLFALTRSQQSWASIVGPAGCSFPSAPAARSSRPSAGGRPSDSGASSAPADTPAAEGQARAPPASAIGRNAGKSRLKSPRSQRTCQMQELQGFWRVTSGRSVGRGPPARGARRPGPTPPHPT